jgi:hypothetical protein
LGYNRKLKGKCRNFSPHSVLMGGPNKTLNGSRGAKYMTNRENNSRIEKMIKGMKILGNFLKVFSVE